MLKKQLPILRHIVSAKEGSAWLRSFPVYLPTLRTTVYGSHHGTENRTASATE
jgi:hypothetical protein